MRGKRKVRQTRSPALFSVENWEFQGVGGPIVVCTRETVGSDCDVLIFSTGGASHSSHIRARTEDSGRAGPVSGQLGSIWRWGPMRLLTQKGVQEASLPRHLPWKLQTERSVDTGGRKEGKEERYGKGKENKWMGFPRTRIKIPSRYLSGGNCRAPDNCRVARASECQALG